MEDGDKIRDEVEGLLLTIEELEDVIIAQDDELYTCNQNMEHLNEQIRQLYVELQNTRSALRMVETTTREEAVTVVKEILDEKDKIIATLSAGNRKLKQEILNSQYLYEDEKVHGGMLSIELRDPHEEGNPSPEKPESDIQTRKIFYSERMKSHKVPPSKSRSIDGGDVNAFIDTEAFVFIPRMPPEKPSPHTISRAGAVIRRHRSANTSLISSRAREAWVAEDEMLSEDSVQQQQGFQEKINKYLHTKLLNAPPIARARNEQTEAELSERLLR